MDFRAYLNRLEDIDTDNEPQVGDTVGIEMGDTLLETYITDITEDGVIINVDETAIRLMIDAKKQLIEGIAEAKYQGREVPLGKPMAGDVKKSKVYVKGPKGNVVKVNFGDKNMRIKKSNPGRRKNFRARHNCDNPGPRWKARYWSCRAW
jgi:hypothetical protein